MLYPTALQEDGPCRREDKNRSTGLPHPGGRCLQDRRLFEWSLLDARALRPSVQLNSINGKSSIGMVNPSPRQQPGGPNCRPFQAMPRFEGEKAINRDGSLSFNRNIQTKQTYVRAHLINLDTNRGRSNGC